MVSRVELHMDVRLRWERGGVVISDQDAIGKIVDHDLLAMVVEVMGFRGIPRIRLEGTRDDLARYIREVHCANRNPHAELVARIYDPLPLRGHACEVCHGSGWV